MTTVICDLDDVVLDFTGTWRRLYREWFDDEPAAQTRWEHPLGAPRFETREEFFDWFDWIGGWNEIGYVPGAPGGLWDLLGSGLIVRFVTSRHATGAAAAMDWWRQSPWRPKTFLHVNVSDKTLVKGQIHIDDRPKHVNAAVRAGRAAIVFDQPWNQVGVDEAVRRATNWRQVSRSVFVLLSGETDAEGD